MKRQVFFSFYYDDDNWRASQVRNMGKVDSSSTLSRGITSWITTKLQSKRLG